MHYLQGLHTPSPFGQTTGKKAVEVGGVNYALDLTDIDELRHDLIRYRGIDFRMMQQRTRDFKHMLSTTQERDMFQLYHFCKSQVFLFGLSI